MKRIWEDYFSYFSFFAITCVILLVIFPLVNALPDREQSREIYDVAIIGGGVSGCYCGWRLVGADGEKEALNQKLSVHLFEMSDRIGGRLFTVFLPGMPHVPAELGGVRFRSNQTLTHGVAKKLDLTVQEMHEESTDNFVFLRGKRFRASELTDPKVLPYALTQYEEGKTPYELILYALEKLIPEFSSMTIEEWDEQKGKISYNGVKLTEMSWQNFLASFLSSEAYQLLADTGSIHLVNNVSVASQIPGFICQENFTSYQIAEGFQEMPVKLAKAFEKKGGAIHKNHELKSIYKDETSQGIVFRLNFEKHEDEESYQVQVFAKNVILAIPKKAYERLEDDSFIFTKDFKEDLDSVNPVPSTKLFFGYARPWWRSLGLKAGDSVSDFELRSTHYYGTESEAYEGEKGNNNALLLVSYEGSRLPFWQAFAPGKPFEGASNRHVADNKKTFIKEVAISLFGAEQAQRMLSVLHGVKKLPSPYTAAYVDWSKHPYGGEFYHWKIGVDHGNVIKKMKKPFSDLNLFVCGCTFSHMQGWVEGALGIAEEILEENFDLKAPSWENNGD